MNPPNISTAKRVIIGETERAGWPISAPVGELTRPQVLVGALRWRENKQMGTYVLEQYTRLGCCGFGWQEVPCLMDPSSGDEPVNPT